jgi:uncharacterized tellurite resistance protein B-like protein
MEKQLHLLASLALADGEIDPKEKQMILKIGSAHGYDRSEVESILENPEKDLSLEDLSEDEKFEYLVNLVQLMKIDGRTYNGEILYCQEIARRLGFRQEVIMELYKLIYTDPDIRVPDSMIRQTIKEHLEGQ